MSQPAKVLLLYAHPESQDSVANRVLLKPAIQHNNVTVHDLYARYPDFFIDTPYEQALLREHDVIVFQHPLYTYSCPVWGDNQFWIVRSRLENPASLD